MAYESRKHPGSDAERNSRILHPGNNCPRRSLRLGYVVVEGTLYPLLTRLKNAGLLDYAWVESSAGPPRKYYKLTDSGKDFLALLRQTWRELVDSTEFIINKKKA